jgi:sugar phosphate permease
LGKRRVYYGWYVVAACVIVVAASLGFHNTAGIFIRPVTEDLGLSRGEFTFFRTIVFLISAATMPLYGKIAVRFSIKKVMLIGTIFNGLTLVAYSLGTQIWHFYLIAIIGGLVVNSGNFMVCGILISRWFDDKKGLALGIAFAGSGLGAAIMNPAASWIIEMLGWRAGYVFSGVAALAISIPAIIFFIKDTPESVGLKPYKIIDNSKIKAQESPSADWDGLTLQEARKTPMFWLLAILILLLIWIIHSGVVRRRGVWRIDSLPEGRLPKAASLLQFYQFSQRSWRNNKRSPH